MKVMQDSILNIKVKTWKHIAFSSVALIGMNGFLLLKENYPDMMHLVNAAWWAGTMLYARSMEMKEDDLQDIEQWVQDMEAGKIKTYTDSVNYSPLRKKR